MNAAFKEIYDAVVVLTGKNNLHDMISVQIGLVTLEEHGARNYDKDIVPYSWLQSDGVPLNEDVSKEQGDQQFLSMDVANLVSLKVYTTNHSWENAETITDPRMFLPNGAVPPGIHVLQSGGSIRVKANEPIVAYEYGVKTLPDVTEDGYNSWIGSGLYKSVIVHEVASRVQNTIGDTSSKENGRIAELNRRMLRTTEHSVK